VKSSMMIKKLKLMKVIKPYKMNLTKKRKLRLKNSKRNQKQDVLQLKKTKVDSRCLKLNGLMILKQTYCSKAKV
jgi:hypothetical protein